MIAITNENLQSLLTRIKQKDEEAFKEFFFIMQPHIFYYIFRFVYNRTIAEDLTQETFIKFWLNADKIDPSKSGKAYLYKIAHNLSINSLKRKSGAEYVSDEHLNTIPMNEASIDFIFMEDEYQKAVNSLPERCRAVFTLCRFDGLEYAEIAEVLGISLQTVKNQMSKALAVLRKRLQNFLN